MTGSSGLSRMKRRRARRELFAGWLFLLPAAAILGVFVMYPALDSFYLSLHDVDGFTGQLHWAGLDNYKLLAVSPEYLQSLRVSLAFTALTVFPSVVLSLVLALALDANPYFRGLFRAIFLLPVAISSAMAAMLWIFFYNPTAGYLNYLLELLGLPGPSWLASPAWALVAVAIATVWKEIGFNIIFFLAGLASVPTELTEAASIDGAGPWQRFRHVTLPMISPTLFFVLVVSVIHSFESFGQIHILTAGGPAGSTSTLVYRLYRDAFENFQTGSASAQAVILFLIMVAATAVQFRLARKRVHY